VRKVIPPLQVAHTASPVNRIGPVITTWRRCFWIAGFQPTLDLLKDVGIDDG